MTDDFHERRQYKRISLEAAYSLKVGNETYLGKTGNISLGGVYLQTYEPAFSHDILHQQGLITLSLGGDSITMRCIIIYVGGYQIPLPDGAGVAFENEDKAELDKLSRFLGDSI